jgi:hypothetical protein
MRLVEAKIKEAIVHPEKLAREAALIYFAESHSRDLEVMPLAIQAIERYGRGPAFGHFYLLAGLPQTEATVEWAIRELHTPADQIEDPDGYFTMLSSLLCDADPRSLDRHVKDILETPGFLKDLIPVFQDQRELHKWDAERCWKELEELSKRAVEENESETFDFERADRIVMHLARQGDRYADRILEVLRLEIEGFDDDPMAWMQNFMVLAAGEMRLESAVPRLIQMLHISGEDLDEDYVAALVKIGTDAVVEALTENWSQTDWGFKLFATTALEQIHSDASVRKCLDLLPGKEDVTIRTKLATALMAQFDPDAVESVREMVKEKNYDEGYANLKRHLVAACSVMGVTFPEYAQWKRDIDIREARRAREQKETWSFLNHPRTETRDTPLAPLKAPLVPYIEDEEQVRSQANPVPLVRDQQQVGRNDPCPCGSGKKFKKCCLSKRSMA